MPTFRIPVPSSQFAARARVRVGTTGKRNGTRGNLKPRTRMPLIPGSTLSCRVLKGGSLVPPTLFKFPDTSTGTHRE
eukprot:2959185-Rhodomonas_salina.1